MDELNSVNPLVKSDRWMLENYPRDSLSSSSGGAATAETTPAGASGVEQPLSGIQGIASPAKQLLLLKDGRGDTSYFSASSPVPLPVRQLFLPFMVM
jgi:hypothetical protein